MSHYPISLDKERTFKYGMKAIDLLEKKFKKPMGMIEGLNTGILSMSDYATVMWAGLVHEDRDLTPIKVMELIDEHSTIKEATEIMWKAMNEIFGASEEVEILEGEETKNE